MLVLVDLVVEFELQLFLRHFNEEVADGLWNSVSDISNNDSEISINSCSNFLNECVGAFLWLLSLLLVLRVVWVVWLVWLLLVVLGCDDLSSILQIIDVVCKEVILL